MAIPVNEDKLLLRMYAIEVYYILFNNANKQKENVDTIFNLHNAQQVIRFESAMLQLEYLCMCNVKFNRNFGDFKIIQNAQ